MPRLNPTIHKPCLNRPCLTDLNPTIHKPCLNRLRHALPPPPHPDHQGPPFPSRPAPSPCHLRCHRARGDPPTGPLPPPPHIPLPHLGCHEARGDHHAAVNDELLGGQAEGTHLIIVAAHILWGTCMQGSGSRIQGSREQTGSAQYIIVAAHGLRGTYMGSGGQGSGGRARAQGGGLKASTA